MGKDFASGKAQKTLHHNMARTDIRKESFAIRVVETWNRLPDRVKLTEKPESFKKELKKIMMAWTQKER
jgi:hypothetical protein